MDHGPDTRERIIYEKSGPIARITLNWPEKANAQDQKLAEEVDAALLDADRDYDVKVLILRANGKGFCSGHAIGNNARDYPSFAEGAQRTGTPWKAQTDLFVKPTLNLWEFSKPTIAQVHGYCLAGGTDLALFCDDPKAVEIALINQNVRYEVHSQPGMHGQPVDVLSLHSFCRDLSEVIGVHLRVYDLQGLRGALVHDAQGRSPRGDIAALQRLLAQEAAQ